VYLPGHGHHLFLYNCMDVEHVVKLRACYGDSGLESSPVRGGSLQPETGIGRLFLYESPIFSSSVTKSVNSFDIF